MKAIDTEYKGYLFRSRLEARWAVFFDACGVKWEYEPEGFDLGDGIYYLPDFLLHDVIIRYNQGNIVQDLWVEVKGKMTRKDAYKINRFANCCKGLFGLDAENPILVVSNIPFCDDFVSEITNISYDDPDYLGINAFNFLTIDSDNYAAIPCVNKKGKFILIGGDYIDKTIDYKKTERAYKLARQARFEHGQTPLIGR